MSAAAPPRPADPSPTELLTFQLSDQEYALEITAVREIRGWTRATPLPQAPTYLKGVINLRGTVLPVLDLAERLGLAPRAHSDRNVIIVVASQDITAGLLVDAVSDIITVAAEDLQPPPDGAAPGGQNALRALTLLEERMIRVLDLAPLIEPSEGVAA